MIINKVLKVILLLLGITYVVLQSFAFELEGAAVGALILILLTFLYYKWTASKTKYFLWFLLIFTIAQIISFFGYFGPKVEGGQINYVYFIINLLFILSYIILTLKLLVKLKLRKIFSEFPIPILVLIILDIFCVNIVTSTTENVLNNYAYVLEFVYNAVIMILLSVALINYMYRNDNKSMLFLIGSICIVFSEIIQLAYFYIIDSNDLGFIHSFFFIVAFLLFYLQSQLEFTGPQPTYIDEKLEV